MAGVTGVYATLVLWKESKNVTVNVTWKASKLNRGILKLAYHANCVSRWGWGLCPPTPAISVAQNVGPNPSAQSVQSYTYVLASYLTAEKYLHLQEWSGRRFGGGGVCCAEPGPSARHWLALLFSEKPDRRTSCISCAVSAELRRLSPKTVSRDFFTWFWLFFVVHSLWFCPLASDDKPSLAYLLQTRVLVLFLFESMGELIFPSLCVVWAGKTSFVFVKPSQ